MQQYLPFTVLKQMYIFNIRKNKGLAVATVLTVYGIETSHFCSLFETTKDAVATVLTVYGIETFRICVFKIKSCHVATVLTVYGIETRLWSANTHLSPLYSCNSTYRLRY